MKEKRKWHLCRQMGGYNRSFLHMFTLRHRGEIQRGREALTRQLLKVEKRVSVDFFFFLLCFCLQFHCFQAALDLMWKIRKDWLVMSQL